jgi:5-methylcytosine-specific restriction protein A
MLKTLAPTLPALNTNRVKVLETKAGSTERLRGDAWMKIRHALLLRGGFACVDCGHISMTNQIDHEIPLEQGGTHDMNNLKIRCVRCHTNKTNRENRVRFGLANSQ